MFGTYVVRRCLIAIPVLFGVSLLSYALLSVTAGDVVPGLALNPNITAADIERIRNNLGLNEPFWQQYTNWAGLLWPFGKLGLFHGRYTTGLLEGNFGISAVNGVPVMSIISTHLGNTVELTATAMVIGILIAIPFGVFAARNHGGWIDNVLTALSVAGVAVPSFWLGLILILLFAVEFSQWGLPSLPTGGAVSSFGGGGIADRIVHLVLPACVLAFGYLAVWSRYMRSSMLDVLSQDYMRTAQSKGMGALRAIYVHGLRNAIIPLVTLIGLELPNLFAGSAIIEIVFSWPGLGLEAYQAATDHDFTVVMALTVFVATMVVLGNLVADLLYAVLDPPDPLRMIGASPGVETVETAAGVPGSASRGYWQQVLLRLVRNRVALVCGIIQLLLVLIAILANPFVHLVLHQDPYAQDLTQNLVGIGQDGHLLGTDQLGRDVAARLVYGAQVSLLVGYLTVALQILIGGTLGIIAGYYGGAVDALLMRLVDIVLSIPSIFLLILLGSLSPKIGPITLGTSGPVTLAVIIALISWGGVARLVRAEALATKQRDFVLATRSLGAGDARIMFQHLLPNVVSVMVVAASLSVGGVILVEAALDYIGLGITPPTASWGNMISDAQQYFYHSVSIVVLPGAAIFLTVLAMNLFGNGLRDAIDPRLRRFR